MSSWIRTLSPRLLLALALAAAAGPALAQQVTRADYERAERMLSASTNRLVYHAGVRPTWLPDGRFWYRVTTVEGAEYLRVDPASGSREPAFDHDRLAAALSAASGQEQDGSDLTLLGLEFAYDGNTILFRSGERPYSCDLVAYRCTLARPEPGAEVSRNEIPSPDGHRVVFIRENNLWVRELATGEERAVTRDGVEDYGYGTDNAGWRRSDRPVVKWSPDSRRIATFQQDQRGVGEMYLVNTRVGHPELTAWKYPLPGDSIITMIEPVVIDIDEGSVVRLRLPAVQHRSSQCDDVACRGDWGDVQWAADSSSLAFLSTSRDHKRETLYVADVQTGAVRQALEETETTFFESGNGGYNWRYLPESDEILWYSQRDDWGHLYLYQLSTGELKQRITTGEGNVVSLERVDADNRVLTFTGVGFEQGRDPYFIHLYRIGFDGSGFTLLTPEDANHVVSMSPSGDYFVDSSSTPDTPPVAVLRRADGELVTELELADISALVATGWKPPVPITVKARDGVTDLYGLMFVPTQLDERRKYPIINSVYPGPQTGSVGSRNFAPSRGDAQSIAELGFVVVKIDGMGTPWRSKTFHEAYYGDMADNTLPDQVAGMRELAARYPWIDLERAGVYGHSGGGFATAGAMFHYPDFFKVGVAQAGNHDNRVYEDDWGEKWQGLLTRDSDAGTNYDSQANQNFAANLKGKLLIAHGTMDTNVPFYNTLLVVNALIEANKDFDLILFPNRNHGFGNEPYMMRRRWDYFVKNLLGVEPPEYEIGQLGR